MDEPAQKGVAGSRVTDGRAPLVLHLVHGTWPFGLWRRRSRRGRPAWFEEGATVRAEIARRASAPFETRVFLWSGRNSFRAREAAAASLRDHLHRARAERPDSVHVVLAHSHGGTVAAQAVTDAHFPPDHAAPVAGLICLATPFAFPILATRQQRALIAFSVGSLVAALLLALVITIHGVGETPGFLLLAASFLISATVALWINRTFRSVDLIARWSVPVRYDVPVYILRSSRDETGLALGLAQAIHAIVAKVSGEAQNVNLSNRPLITRATVFILPFVLIGLTLTLILPETRALTSGQRAMIGFVFGSGAAGLLYLGAYAALAWAAGFLPLPAWPVAMPEVDSLPPDTPCAVKSYVDLNPDACPTRHGIYGDPKVIADIANLIDQFASGFVPRFLNAAEMAALQINKVRAAATPDVMAGDG